jgi:hypothetical protein
MPFAEAPTLCSESKWSPNSAENDAPDTRPGFHYIEVGVGAGDGTRTRDPLLGKNTGHPQLIRLRFEKSG